MGHQHLSEEAVEQAAERVIGGHEAPDCPVCLHEVTDLARYLVTARAVAGVRTEPAGRPAANAIRRLRRSTYMSRVLRELSRTLSRSAQNVQR